MQKILYIESGLIHQHRNRKNHNQYFTPEFAVEKALSFISEAKIKNVIDPAVGNGVFLKKALEKWTDAKLFGIDIDKDVISRLRESNLPHSCLFVKDGLLPSTWHLPEIQMVLLAGGFDLVAGNPPFSSWFQRISSEDILSNYELGKNKKSQAIEVLFLELFVRLAKNEGFIIIVLPDGILSNPKYRYVREFILENTKVLHIINLPRNVFKKTSAKTSILILKKLNENDLSYSAKLHDLEKTGKVNYTIEVTGKDLLNRMDYHYYSNLQKSTLQELIDNGIVFKQLKDFVTHYRTGKTLYGKEREFSNEGLRFLHATNITEIGINYRKDKKFIEPSSKMNFQNAHTKVGDILFVRVGAGCAGRVAIVDTEDDEGVATDYIHIFRVKGINPYFLVVYLKTKFGKASINLLRHGVGTVSINKADVLSIPIPVVDKDTQFEIERRYRNILSEYRANGDDASVMPKFLFLINFLEERLYKICADREHTEKEICYVEV